MSDIEPVQDVPTPAPATTKGPITTDHDFALIVRQAEYLAGSNVIPKSYQGKPADIVAAAIMGKEVNYGLMTSLRLIHVIEGKPEFSAEAMNALVRQAGHSISGEVTHNHARATGTRRGTGDTMTVTFTMEDAENAGLAGRGVWKKYPRPMMWARAVSMLCTQLFPDVTLGGYVQGEISGDDMWETPTKAVEPDAVSVADVETGEIIDVSEADIYAEPERVNLVLDLIATMDDTQKNMVKAFMHENKVRSFKMHTPTLAEVDVVHQRVVEILDEPDPARYSEPF